MKLFKHPLSKNLYAQSFAVALNFRLPTIRFSNRDIPVQDIIGLIFNAAWRHM